MVDEASSAKVNPKGPFDKIYLLGYGVATCERNLDVPFLIVMMGARSLQNYPIRVSNLISMEFFMVLEIHSTTLRL
jgi:hypothetical protein